MWIGARDRDSDSALYGRIGVRSRKGPDRNDHQEFHRHADGEALFRLGDLLGIYRFFYDVFEKPGYLLLAVGGSTARYVSLDEHDFTAIPGEGLSNGNQRGQATGAFYLKQVFWEAEGNKDRNAWVYLAGSYGDDNPSFSQWTYFVSLNAVGLISQRPKDRMGASFYQTGLTHDVKQLTQTAGIGLRNMWGPEFFYNAEINPWMHLTGDLQIVKNENQGDDTAVIPGLRLVMDF